MDEKLIKAYSIITQVGEMLESGSTSFQERSNEEIQREIELCEKKIAGSERILKQAVAMYGNQFGELSAIGGKVEETVFRNAEKDFNDAELRNLLFAPSKGIFAKKPKEADYRRFCIAAMAIRSYCSAKLVSLKDFQEKMKVLKPEQMQEIQTGIYNAKANFDESCDNWTKFPQKADGSKELYLGDLEIPVNNIVEKALSKIGVVDEREDGSWLELPFSYHAKTPFSLFIEYEGDTREGELKLGNLIRNIMYQVLHAMVPYSYEFVYIDPLRGGTGLKEMNAKLSSALDGNAFRLREELYPDHMYQLLRVAANKEESRQILNSLEERIAKISSICGGKTVAEYNASQFDEEGNIKEGCSGVIPQVFVFVENTHSSLDNNFVPILRKLAECATQAGITLVMTSLREKRENLTKEESELLSQDRYREYFDRILWEEDTGSFYCDASLLGQETGEQLFYNFNPCFQAVEHEAFLDLVCEGFRPTLDVETRYEKRIQIDNIWGMGNAAKEMEIPIGVNARNQIMTITLGGPDGPHGMLAGTNGCGKSSYLHSIINSVIIKYKPTDVQIWLSDYKIAEFKRYMKNTPPHIGYVGAARSVEYTLNFLDRIHEEFERRVKAFGTLTSVEEYRSVHGEESMPRLFIVIDEFHVMSNHVKDFPEYKQKLTSLLREARAMGITFLFSDQTCGVGLQGLSEDGKLQLSRRMAMMTSIEEYNAVFNITNARDVVPVQQKFEVVVARTEKRINSKGVAENVKFYEHCKTLFIAPEMRDEVARRSIECYGPAVDPLFVEDAERKQANWELIGEEEKKGLPQRGMPIYVGTPLSMKAFFNFRMLTNYSENMVSVMPFDEIQSSIFVSQLQSVRRIPGYEIYIIADQNDFLYGSCEYWIDKEASGDSRIHVMTYIDDVCDIVCKLYNEMVDRRRQRNFGSKIFVFWMGLYDIVREMSYFGDKRPDGKLMSVTSTSKINDELGSLMSQFDKLFGEDATDGGMEEISEEVVTENSDLLYNAASDIRELMEEGPKRDIHHFVYYSSVPIAKKTKCAPLDCFVHKIALAIGKDDALEFFGAGRMMTNAEGNQLDNNTAVYYNGRTSEQFKPFISELEEKLREQT